MLKMDESLLKKNKEKLKLNVRYLWKSDVAGVRRRQTTPDVAQRQLMTSLNDYRRL